MPHFPLHIPSRKRPMFLLGTSLLLLTLLLSACGGGMSSAGSGTTSTGAINAPTSGQNNSGSASGGASGSSSGSGKSSSSSLTIITQYLIKTLKVSMDVKDTTKAADDIQSWISNTDPRSTSAGIDYEQTGSNLYNISISFSVQSTLYPQVQRYLRDYASQHGGHLLTFSETVQDVTNDYIDTQSRLTNLRSEQTRLLTLLSHAQVLGDVISIQDRLTDVEGQIETIEAHLKALNGQVTFYTVAIMLQPVALAAPSSTQTGWNIGQVFGDAFASSLVFAQGLAAFLIWLLAYSFYIIPLALVAWYLLRRRARWQQPAATPPSATPPTPAEPASV